MTDNTTVTPLTPKVRFRVISEDGKFALVSHQIVAYSKGKPVTNWGWRIPEDAFYASENEAWSHIPHDVIVLPPETSLYEVKLAISGERTNHYFYLESINDMQVDHEDKWFHAKHLYGEVWFTDFHSVEVRLLP